MHTDQFLAGNAEHTERIGIPQVGLGGIRYVLHIRQDLDFIRRHAGGFQPFVVKLHIPVTVIHQSLEPFQLQGLQVPAGHTFHILVPNGVHCGSPPPCFHAFVL